MKATGINRRVTAAFVASASLLIVALAAVPAANAATIYACQKKKGGAIHIVTKKAKCKKGETKLSWNTSGPAGKNGANGTNGKDGKNGEPGQPQKAVTFNQTLESSFEPPATAPLFSLSGVSVKMVCFFFLANFNIIEASGPNGSRAETGMVITNSEGKAPEVSQEAIKDVSLTPSFTKIAQLTTNTKAPFANIGHLNGSISTSGAAILFDAFVEAGPNPAGCTVRGTAFSIPL